MDAERHTQTATAPRWLFFYRWSAGDASSLTTFEYSRSGVLAFALILFRSSPPKPWHAEHADGRIPRPLLHNGQKYSGINILTLWMSAELQGFQKDSEEFEPATITKAKSHGRLLPIGCKFAVGR